MSYHTVGAGIDLALANKESLVAGGKLITHTAKRTGAKIIPIDSEHSAIFQCLLAGRRDEVEKIVLTASGGPFRSRPLETFESITVAEALKHPNWSMGRKITIDSATMMNKALEVIEARYLFDVEPSQIDVVVHPESIVHSLVQFRDGALVAQLSPPDMRLPISYALEYPARLATDLSRLDFAAIPILHFQAVDTQRFPAVSLAYQALESGGIAPLVLNAANEVAVEAFLADRIKFVDIASVVDRALSTQLTGDGSSLEGLREADRRARLAAEKLICVGTS